MPKFAFLSALALLFAIPVAAQTDPLLDFRLEKRQTRFQNGPSSVVSPAGNSALLDYSFRPNTNAAITATFQGPQLNVRQFTLQSRDRWAGHHGFGSTAELDITYPNGQTMTFNTEVSTVPGLSQSWGWFINGAQYSFNPPILSAASYQAIQAMDPFQPLTLNLLFSGQGLAGGGFQPFIELTVFDPVRYTVVYQQTDIPADQFSITIPAGALAAGNAYPARIRFICPDSERDEGINHYPVLSRFINETVFQITTLNAPAFTGEVTVTLESEFEQTGPASFTPLGDGPKLHASYPDTPSVEEVSFTLPLARRARVLTRDDDEGPFTYEEADIASAALVDGLVGVAARLSDGRAVSRLSLASFDDPVGGSPVNNWQAAQTAQTPVGFPIFMNRPDGFTGGFTTEMEVRDLQGELIATFFAFAAEGEDEAAITIPAGALEAESQYRARVRVQPFGANQAEGLNLVAASDTEFDLRTAPLTWPGVRDVELFRSAYFDNQSGETGPDEPFSVNVTLVESTPGALANASVRRDRNLQPTTALIRDGDRAFALVQTFADEAARNAAWPAGYYRFATNDGGNGEQTGNLELAADTPGFPPTLIDTALLQSGEIDPGLPIPVSWSGFDAASPNTEVTVQAFNPLNGDLLYSGELIGISGNGQLGFIPGGALDGDREYRLRVAFRQLTSNDRASFDGVALKAGEENWTFISVVTGESAYGNWQAFKFTPEQRADPAISGPTANPDGDAFNNLAEFALDLQPLQFSLPPEITERASQWAFRFKVRKNYPLLTYAAASSETLEDPFTPNPDAPVTVETSADYDTVEARFEKTRRLFATLLIEYLGQLPESE